MRTLIRLVALVQIAGAIMAVFLTATRPAGWLDSVLVALLVVASLLGGVALWRGRSVGRRLSLVVQSAQVLRVQTAPVAYLVAAGPLAVLGVQDGQLAITGGVGGGAYISLGSGPVTPSFVGINLAALACTAVVYWARPRTDRRSAGLPVRET